MSRNAFVTGGLGFIDNQCCRDLLHNGFPTVHVDIIDSSRTLASKRFKRIGHGHIGVHRLEVTDGRPVARRILDACGHVVVHLVSYKVVGDSVEKLMEYYTNTLAGGRSFLGASRTVCVRHLVYSSSCSLYEDTGIYPISEGIPAHPVSPYAWTAWMAEIIRVDACDRHDDWSVITLGYSNFTGVLPNAIFGEIIAGLPRNTVPFVGQLTTGNHKKLSIIGVNQSTPNGTPDRADIHIPGVMEAHRAALVEGAPPGSRPRRLCAGRSTSVVNGSELSRNPPEGRSSTESSVAGPGERPSSSPLRNEPMPNSDDRLDAPSRTCELLPRVCGNATTARIRRRSNRFCGS